MMSGFIKKRNSFIKLLVLVILNLGNVVAFAQDDNPADFIGTIDFPGSSVVQFNQFGSYGLSLNGLKANIKTDQYHFLTTYSYRNFNGFRLHNNEYGHNLDIALETNPSHHTSLNILGYFVTNQVMFPGSLTKEEFNQDPFQADPRAVNRNEKRISRKGGVDIVYDAKFGRSVNNEIQIRSYGIIEFMERSTKEFKIKTRYILGMTAEYKNTSRLFNRVNEFIIGGELFTQPERTEEYENFSGQKSDQLEQLENEKMNKSGCYISDHFEILRDKLFFSLSGRYENNVYQVREEILPSRHDKKPFHAFTPNLSLDYKIIPWITLFTSYGLSFRSPTEKQLESPVPEYLYNQDLKAQTTYDLELGMKGDLQRTDSAHFFRRFLFEAKFFKDIIDNEIVRYEIYGDEYYRNATKTNRFGIELGGKAEIFKELTFTYAYTLTHFIYNSYTANSLEEDSTGNLIAVKRDFSGHSEPNIPVNNLRLSLAYKYVVSKKIAIFAKVGYNGSNGLWVNDANSDKTNGYNLLNSTLGVDMRFGHVAVSALGGIDNIFNEVYVGNSNFNSADKRFFNAGAPRNYYFSLNIGYVF